MRDKKEFTDDYKEESHEVFNTDDSIRKWYFDDSDNEEE